MNFFDNKSAPPQTKILATPMISKLLCLLIWCVKVWCTLPVFTARIYGP